jgi:serine/threonine-protein kinase
VLYLISLVDFHTIPRFEMLGYAWAKFGYGLALCAVLWLLYIALEPLVRARWPHSLCTWNRVLAGQIGDPRVGSHILVGAVIAVAMTYLFVWRTHWLIAGGAPLDDSNLNVLLGIRPFVNAVANIMFNALLTGTGMFFLICGLRAVVRYDWAAAALAAVLLSFQEGTIRTSTHLMLDLPLFLIVYGIFFFVLLRMGLVPMYTGIFVINVISAIPVSADFASWYNPAAVVLIAIVCAIAIYGFVRSQSRASEESVAAQAWRAVSSR